MPIRPTVPTRRLGETGPVISTVGIGTWAMGGSGWAYSWGPQTDDESLAALRHALARGINWIDTAPIYGLGHAEAVVGRLLLDLPAAERPLVFTKCGLLWDPAAPTRAPRRDLTPRSIRRECEASLKRLGVEAIDLFQFHWPDETRTPIEYSWEEMIRLRDEGKVRALGVCNFDAGQLDTCARIGRVDSLQIPMSLIQREAALALVPWCANHGTGVLAYSPLQSGLLSGAFSSARLASLAGDDWRRRAVEFQSPRFERNLSLADALRRIAARYDTTVAAVAIAWVLAWPGVTAAIAGARSPGQVDEWIGAATLDLTPEDMQEITAAIRRSGAGEGPVRPEDVETWQWETQVSG